MYYRFRSVDCPSANGRVAQDGEATYTLSVSLEEGGRLDVQMGRAAINELRAVLDNFALEDGSCSSPTQQSS